MQRFVELTAAEWETAVQKLQEFHARYADLFRSQTRSAADPVQEHFIVEGVAQRHLFGFVKRRGARFQITGEGPACGPG